MLIHPLIIDIYYMMVFLMETCVTTFYIDIRTERKLREI